MSWLDYSTHIYSSMPEYRDTDDLLRNSYFSVYEGNISENDNNMHWHDFFEVIYVEKGEVLISGTTDKITLHENEVLFINSDFLHSIQNNSKDQTCNIRSIVAHSYFITNVNEKFLFDKYLKNSSK